MKIGAISLGCDKNRVDTEKMLGIVSLKHQITGEILDADVVIINTCAFLQSAREEAIDEILEVCELKKRGSIKKIIVTGCLPQKFVDEMIGDLEEVDAFLGVSDYSKILDVIDGVINGEKINAVGTPKCEDIKTRILTTQNFAYLKIADGCSNHCTYCLIPKIRGKFRSTPVSDLIEEAKGLGYVKELILVAQDVTCYGKDFNDGLSVVTLIKELSKLSSIEKIRLLYCYPENITDALIDEIETNEKVVKYIDVPFQHADDLVLKRMNRKGTFESYLTLINTLKERVKGIAIRSTFITGFPGETRSQFNTLKKFIKKAKLFNAGFFAYSREEDTPADKLDGHLDEAVKLKRQEKLYKIQKKVVKNNLKSYLNKTVKVVCDYVDYDDLNAEGRAYFNAPDIDGKVYFYAKENLSVGDEIEVRILKIKDYDLFGEQL